MNTFYKELKEELTGDILPYWQKHAKDKATGGFFGAMDNSGRGSPREWRGIVMVSRYLWTYSAATRLLKDASWLDMADYAYRYLTARFYDPLHGGLHWSVKADGTPLVARKQIYGEAFAIYALSEYAAALEEVRKAHDGATVSMDFALQTFRLLEEHARDKKLGGYCEALAEDWGATAETRLSPKDIDCDKSMNTNLHVMEAYTNLYRTLPVVYPQKAAERKAVGAALESLIGVHLERILDKKDFHLNLYFSKNWKQMGKDEISYGHDIEASWLIWEAATELGKKTLQKAVRPAVIRIARVALAEGFDPETGGFENLLLDGKKDRTRIWWNQAEAVNGFYNAWEMTGEEAFGAAAEKVWAWIMGFQKDKKNGEWFQAVSERGVPDLKQAKGGNWKTSYHNARCCMELMRRMKA